MIELKGKYNTAKIYTDRVDDATVGQITALLNQDSVKGNQIRIMSDVHAGKGCVIGTTMTLTNKKVVPNLVGVDIGCFTGDTEVWCAAGFYKPIKEIAENNDYFMTESFDMDQLGFVTAKATAFKTRENAELVEVTYGDRQGKRSVKVHCTPDHKFLTCYEDAGDMCYKNMLLSWVEAAKLKKGTRLVAEDDYIYVESVRTLEEREDVYCLNVPECHNFAIKYGVIVHNCGMLAIKLKEKRIDLPAFDNIVRKYVPAGGNVHDETREDKTSLVVEELRCFNKPGARIRGDLAYKSVGSVGSGNHFLELDKDSEGNIWLVIHTGSRHLGIEVCDYYQEEAYRRIKDRANGGTKKEKLNALIAQLKSEGRDKEIAKEIEKFNKAYKEVNPSVPFELAYVEDDLFDDYIHDMKMVQEHASCNRAEIARIILKHARLHEVERFETIHNYIDTDNMILRKGSVSAQLGEKLLIPINMRDGSLICIGKGNPDWNYSAPHGAGRLMSRSEAKENISMSEFKKTMEDAGIYSTSVNKDTIDESPMAYKPIEEIIENTKDTVDIVDIIKPIYNVKAGGE